MTELLGNVLGGRYRVDQFLGRGGMADVYRVQDLQRAVPLALKVLHADLAADAEFLRRFEREALTLEMLQHPNIVRFYGLEKAGRQAYILMDYIDGLTLRKEIMLSKGGMHPARIVEVLQPVCAALFYAHRKGMVHCDIKPANILIHRNGTVYLTDFGIARFSGKAQPGSGAGTPAYMAPEQTEGHEPAETMDIYALGVVLFEMLTGGERPFGGGVDDAETQKLVWEKQHLPAPSPRKYNPDVPAEFEAITARCLDRDPARRYSSTLDLLHALEVALGGAEDDALTRSGTTAPPKAAELASEHPSRGTRKRLGHPAPWKAALGAALLVGGLLLFSQTARAPAPSFTPPAAAAIKEFSASASPQAEPTPLPTAATQAAEAARTEPVTQPAAEKEPTGSPSPTPQPTPVGGSRWIAFASDRGGSTVQVWIMDAANPENRRQITDITGGACQPAWSPDGTKIAFTSPCNGPSQFYIGASIKIADLDSRAVTDLRLPKNTFDPAWSPDGSTLLYTALVIEETELRALRLADMQVSVLSRRGEKNTQGAWSRDGEHAAFITSDERRRDALWMVGREGDSLEIVNEAAVFAEPVFSPDDSQILASVHHGSNVPYLALVPVNDPTRAETRLMDESYAQHHASFSPDGRWIVFWSELTPAGKGEIMLVENVPGSEPRQLTTNNQRDFHPAWAP